MGFGAFGEQMFTKASQNSDISASCSENIVTVAFYVNVKSCRYFINRLALSRMELLRTMNVLFRTRNLGQHFFDISKKNDVNQSLVSLIDDNY
jgi:hypothetical protein